MRRAGDADALPLPAGKRVRVARAVFRLQADLHQDVRHAVLQLAPFRQSVDHQRLTHDLPDRHARIERGKRILENHLQVRPQRFERPLGQLRQIHHLAVRLAELHLACRRGQRPQDAARRRRLARAGLTHQAERLPGHEVKVHVIHRPDRGGDLFEDALARDREVLAQPADGKQRLGVGCHWARTQAA
jgi:hypothetical protein